MLRIVKIYVICIFSSVQSLSHVQPFATPWTVSYHNKRKWGKKFKVRLFYLLRFLTGNSRIHSTYLCKKCCFGIIEKTWVTRCCLSLQEKSPKTICPNWYHPQITVWQSVFHSLFSYCSVTVVRMHFWLGSWVLLGPYTGAQGNSKWTENPYAL